LQSDFLGQKSWLTKVDKLNGMGFHFVGEKQGGNKISVCHCWMKIRRVGKTDSFANSAKMTSWSDNETETTATKRDWAISSVV
jgi:hypothetical protein